MEQTFQIPPAEGDPRMVEIRTFEEDVGVLPIETAYLVVSPLTQPLGSEEVQLVQPYALRANGGSFELILRLLVEVDDSVPFWLRVRVYPEVESMVVSHGRALAFSGECEILAAEPSGTYVQSVEHRRYDCDGSFTTGVSFADAIIGEFRIVFTHERKNEP